MMRKARRKTAGPSPYPNWPGRPSGARTSGQPCITNITVPTEKHQIGGGGDPERNHGEAGKSGRPVQLLW